MYRDELITGLLSSPIIYVSHFDFNLFDNELVTALHKLGLEDNCILEYDLGIGAVGFRNKCKAEDYPYSEVNALLQDVVEDEMHPGQWDTERVFLLKNLDEKCLHDNAFQTLLLSFAEKHRRGAFNHYGSVFGVVVVSPLPISMLPTELEKVVNVIEFELPSSSEILDLVRRYPHTKSVDNIPDFEESLTRSLLGLQAYEVEQILKSIVARSPKGLNHTGLQWALEEKKRIVKKSGIIEVVDNNDISFEIVGGLEKLKDDLRKKAVLYKNLNEVQGRNIRLPLPKGVLIIGMPGCGKSLIAKAVATEFGVSLLRLDVNRLMGQYVGMSEENLRRALQTAETAHPCVLWIDEVEKAFAGAGAGGGESDMLVQRLMGQFLTWMQERKAAVYIVATANDVMRPEFMRKGRFDDVYFVDFPTLEERKSILTAKLKHYGYLDAKAKTIFDFSLLAVENGQNPIEEIASMMCARDNGKDGRKEDGGFSKGFSGAEIECVVNQLMESKYIAYRSSFKTGEAPPDKAPAVTIDDFRNVIDSMSSSVMAMQITPQKEKERFPHKQTNIERIREMQKTYNFTRATLSK